MTIQQALYNIIILQISQTQQIPLQKDQADDSIQKQTNRLHLERT